MNGQFDIGVHPSVDAFTPEQLCRELSDLENDVFPLQPGEDTRDASAVVTLDHDERLLDGAVEWVHLISAGIDHFPLEKYEQNDVIVTNSSGVAAECMAENVAGLMITLAHRLHTFHQEQCDRAWNPELALDSFTLAGETITVVGLGPIGRAIAEYAGNLGMTVRGVKRTPEPVPCVDELFLSDEVDAAISDSRFVVLVVPLNDGTHELIGSEQFDRMRDDAYLVNVGRGKVVDQPALVTALSDRQIAGAALDVFAEEPLPPGSPLWDMENVVITPHVSGVFSTYYEPVAELVRENADRLAAGEELRNRVA